MRRIREPQLVRDLRDRALIASVIYNRLKAKMRLQRRLVAWTRDLAETLLAPLRDERLAKLGPAARA